MRAALTYCLAALCHALLLSAAALCLARLLAPCRAAPVPPPRAVKPLCERTLKEWMAAPGLVMNWRGTDYAVTFRGADYTADAPAWSGDFSVYRDDDGALRVWVREYAGGDRSLTPLEWTFPAARLPDGRVGGEMPGGGECYPRRAPKREDR
jgi:hypothetical protein